MIQPSCPVCGESDPARVRKVVVEGREICLCDTHAGIVVHERPETFEQLRQLFPAGQESPQAPERRSAIPRRTSGQPDRRAFPRPEGRRMGYGRRATDPRD